MTEISTIPYIISFTVLLVTSMFVILLSKRGPLISFIINITSYVIFLVMLFGLVRNNFPNVLYYSSNYVWALIFAGITALFIIILNGTSGKKEARDSVFLGLIVLGIFYLSNAKDLITFYAAYELINLMEYAIIHESKYPETQKVSMKYLLQGLLVSMIFVVGIAFFYGATGGLSLRYFSVINPHFYHLSMILMLIPLFFKVGIFPFHHWIPQVCCNIRKGPLTTHLLVARFSSIFFLLLFLQNLIAESDPSVQDALILFISSASIISVLYGYLSALAKKDFKLMLIDTSIAHAGFFLMSLFFPSNEIHERQLLSYLLMYFISFSTSLLIMNYFSIIEKNLDRQNFLRGAFHKNKFMGFFLAVFLLSLAGIPLTGGVSTRYLLFVNYFRQEFHFYGIAVLVSSAIGFIIFGKMLHSLFTQEESPELFSRKEDLVPVPLSTKIFVFFMGTIVLIGGVAPNLFIR